MFVSHFVEFTVRNEQLNETTDEEDEYGNTSKQCIFPGNFQLEMFRRNFT